MIGNATGARPRPWAVLLSYTAVVAAIQILWMTFAPLLTEVTRRYQVSELEASLLLIVFPALYVCLSVHAGSLVDRRGVRYVVTRAALVTTACALLRAWDGPFWCLLLAQTGIAAAQPYALNAISKLVADHFEPERVPLATGVASSGIYVGMAAGLALSPYLYAAFGLVVMQLIFAVITLCATIAFLVSATQATGHSGAARTPGTWRALLAHPKLRILVSMGFLGLGTFNALATWLEPILVETNSLSSKEAGLVGATIMAAGIVGSMVVPSIEGRILSRETLMAACGAASTALIYLTCVSQQGWLLWVCAALLGFCFLSTFGLILDCCAEAAGPDQAGFATGVLLLAGNAGGVFLSVSVEAARIHAHGRADVLLMTGGLGLTTILATRLLAVRSVYDTSSVTARAE